MKKGAACTGCRTCELMCPDLAIFVEEAPTEAKESKPAKKKGRVGK
jgi:formate hydrogenlyase subunit 6/NADH:ubiquinone oxidoreductase subunit I